MNDVVEYINIDIIIIIFIYLLHDRCSHLYLLVPLGDHRCMKRTEEATGSSEKSVLNVLAFTLYMHHLAGSVLPKL